jgi:23S rRNA pseudouridine1911/1915/1917 synthase
MNSMSRSQIQKIIKDGMITVNDTVTLNTSSILREGDILEYIPVVPQIEENIKKPPLDLDIIYEDEDLIVINKPVGLTVHPGGGRHSEDTLMDLLLNQSKELSNVGGSERRGIVHRLDRDTSGIMLIAKNDEAHNDLALQIKNKTIIRRYKALIWGVMSQQEGVISLPITRSKKDHTKRTIAKPPYDRWTKEALTRYKTLENFGDNFSLVECQLETGRTHQIRVHLSHSGHSVVGDQSYGNNSKKIMKISPKKREYLMNFMHQALHSFYIEFKHPTKDTLLSFEKDVPIEYNQLVNFLRTK